MSRPDFNLQDYSLEEPEAVLAGGQLWRASSPSQNAGKGRRDHLYISHDKVAKDVNAGEQLRLQLVLTEGSFHPNLLATYGAYCSNGALFVLSEFVPGVSLSVLLNELRENGKKLPVPMALHIAIEVAKALCHCQIMPNPLTGAPRGVVHGQVRPELITVSFGGQVKLCGFGIAELENFALANQRGFFEGSANYTAPERAVGREVDGRSDFFSLGTLLWELLAGRPLYPAAKKDEWLRVLTEKTPPPASQVNPEVPAELDTVLSKLLDRDMYLRYELGEKAARDLEAVMKFRFPDFAAPAFAAYLHEVLARRKEAYLTGESGTDRSTETTKELDLSQAMPSPASAVVEAFNSVPSEPATTEPDPMPVAAPIPAWSPKRAQSATGVAREASPFDFAFAAPGVRWAFAVGALMLVLTPLIGPKLLKKAHSRAPAKAREVVEKTGTLHFVSHRKNFIVSINGKPVEVIDDRADVPADRELTVKASLPGHDDIETVTQISPGEDFDIRLDFKKGDSESEH